MELDLTDKKIARFVEAPFGYFALYIGVQPTDKDFDYLLNTIKKPPCFGFWECLYLLNIKHRLRNIILII